MVRLGRGKGREGKEGIRKEHLTGPRMELGSTRAALPLAQRKSPDQAYRRWTGGLAEDTLGETRDKSQPGKGICNTTCTLYMVPEAYQKPTRYFQPAQTKRSTEYGEQDLQGKANTRRTYSAVRTDGHLITRGSRQPVRGRTGITWTSGTIFFRLADGLNLFLMQNNSELKHGVFDNILLRMW